MKSFYSWSRILPIILCSISANSALAQVTLQLTPSNHNGYNISCFGGSDGSIDLTVSGATSSYTIEWSTPGKDTSEDVSGLASGYYHVTVYPDGGDKVEGEITLTQPPMLTGGKSVHVYANGYNISCNDCFNGIISINMQGGVAPYSYFWDDSITGQAHYSCPKEAPGVVVTDANGCTLSYEHTSLSLPPKDEWAMDGNTGSDPSTQFIGTSDNQDFAFRTNNAEKLRIKANGNIGIGTTSPTHALDIVRTLSGGGDYGALLNITSSGTSSFQRGMFAQLNAGYTGSSQADALVFSNLAAGTGNSNHFDGNYNGNHGFFGGSTGTTSGTNVGGIGYARKGNINIGMYGAADDTKSGATNIGIGGIAFDPTGSGKLIGGCFRLNTTYGTAVTFVSTALLADNGNVSAPIFIGRDNGTEVFRIDDGGNIGIGTTSPNQKLHVVGNSVFTQSTSTITSAAFIKGANSLSGASTPDYSWWGDTLTGIFHPSKNRIAFSVGGSEKIRIDSSGNVGIGKNTPVFKLDINGTINASDVNINGQPLSTKFWTSNGNSSSNPDSQFIGTIDSNAFVFRTNNLERIRVEATGIIAMKAGVRINNFAGHGMQIVYADASGNLRLGDPITHDPNGVPNTLYNCSGDGLSITEVPWKRETIGKVFLCGEKVGINNPNPSEDLDVIGTIKASTLGSTGSGSLSTSGIVIANGDGKLDKLPNGTTNQVLSISGWINPQNLGQWSVGTNPNNIYYSGGSVGIGTNSPLQTLDVNGRIRVNYGVIQKGTTSTISAITTTADLGLYSLNAGDYMRFVTNGSPFRFFTDPDLGTAPSGNGSVFTIESNGNVGIGTSSAASKLHIKGTGSTDAVLLIEPGQWSAVGDYGEIRFGNSSHFIRGEYSRGITIYDANQISLMGGNVGIGTTPNYKLDVSGTVNALGYLLNGLPLSTSQWQDNSSNIYFDNGGGNVSIGTTDATYKLNVCGAIHSTEVKVDASGWCDFVFENDYLRMSFQEQINYFKQNKHLIGMPSAKEVESKGLEVSTAMKGLTLNMEETKLDILDLYKMIVEIKKENSQLKEENQLLEKKIISIQSKR